MSKGENTYKHASFNIFRAKELFPLNWHRVTCCHFLQTGDFPRKYLQFPFQSEKQLFTRIPDGARFPQPLPLRYCTAHTLLCYFCSLFFILLGWTGPEALDQWQHGWTEQLVTQGLTNLTPCKVGDRQRPPPCTHRAAPRHLLWLQLLSHFFPDLQ